MKIGIIGAGISGISAAKLLQNKGYDVTLFEKKKNIGGLVACSEVENNLFHKVGGHVFNSKSKKVNNWFWRFFDKEKEFIKAKRKATIFIDKKFIPYPIENHLNFLPKEKTKTILKELININSSDFNPTNLEEFFQYKFGKTLTDYYFRPYNKKIWKIPLSEISLDWLKDKLPMPNIIDILSDNIYKQDEEKMVHSTFYYPKKGGSQFIVDRLAKGINKNNIDIEIIEKQDKVFILNKIYKFDKLIFTGNIKDLNQIYYHNDDKLKELSKKITDLKSTGTKTILCSCDANPYSWVYLPDPSIDPHRIIMTGNFSKNNNSSALPKDRITCTIETSFIDSSNIKNSNINFKEIPFNLLPIKTNIEENSYIIHSMQSRKNLEELRAYYKSIDLYCCGRFAQWEYFNMDTAIESAMELVNEF